MKRGISAQMLWAVTALIAAITAGIVGVYFVRSSNTTNIQTDKNRQVIEELQAEITASNASIEADRAAEADKVECVTRFTYAIQAASSNLLVDLGDLVIVIATTVPGPERDSAIGDGVTRVKDSVAAYRMTVLQRIDFDVKGSPLPCPLKPGLTG